jgi:hypothetical protein
MGRKMKEYLSKLLVVIIAALAPIQAVIISVGVLVLADMVTGIWAAYKRGETIKSAGLRRTVSKLLIYQIAIITGFVVEQYLVGGLIPIVKILGGVIGLVELKSILENANTINGSDLFKDLISRIGSQNDIKDLVNKK